MLLKNVKFMVGSIFVIMVLVLGVFAVGVHAETREWKIDDSKFENISGKTTTVIDGLTIYPGIYRFNSLKLFKGTKYYNYLYMDVSNNRNRNSVSFYLNGDSNIYIIGRSDGQDTDKRRIAFYFEETGETQYITMGPAKGYKLEDRGEATNVYINAVDDDVRIYDIAVEDYLESEYEELDDNESYYWDFSNFANTSNLTQYTSNININSNIGNKILTGTATGDNPIESYIGVSTDSGYRFYYGLSLKGMGSRYYRSIVFDVPKNADIYITARASKYGTSNVTRDLYVTNLYECDIEEYDGLLQNSVLKVGGTTTTYRVRYRGNGEKIQLKSKGSGIRIYKIEVAGHSEDTIDDNGWTFDDYNELAEGELLYNTTIDGLKIMSNSVRPAKVIASTEENFTKAVQMTSSYFDEASKIIFKVSDSSNNSSNIWINKNRKIRVVAKGYDINTRLILGNKFGYIYGSYKMSTDMQEYVFNYDGYCEDLYLFTYSQNSLHKISEIYSISTSDIQSGKPTEINIYYTNGNTYKYNFNVENIENPSDYYYVINYDSSKLTLMNIGMDYNNSNVITDSNVQVISNTAGEIKFRILNLNEDNWSGIITSAVFKATATGNGTIKFSAVRG